MDSKGAALVTGASSGIGSAIAVALQRDGYQAYGGARRVERLEQLRKHGVRPLQLDVTDEASMKDALGRVHEEVGRVSVLVNNAGYGLYGSLEEVPMSEARHEMDVNLFGLARLTQMVVPEMRRARQGSIINISSVGGKFGEPFGAWYHASKYAVEGLSDSLALELAPFGVKVVTIEPGGIRSEWSEIAADNLLKASGAGDYAAEANKAAQRIRDFYETKLAGSPEQVAEGVIKVLRRRSPNFRYAVAGGAKPLMLLRKLTTDRLFYAIYRRLA
jgi:NAD(P)-dependent dehydrogenase (short-subunit alcohol dehydrogenase family)